MGYQESIIHTSLNNVEKNNKEIDQIISLFQKYGCRCEGDMFANCTDKLHFTRDIGKYKDGMNVLVVCGERDVQRSSKLLFNISPYSDSDIDKKDLHLIKKIKLTPLEDVLYILPMEDSGIITREKLTLVPFNTKDCVKESDSFDEDEKDDVEP